MRHDNWKHRRELGHPAEPSHRSTGPHPRRGLRRAGYGGTSPVGSYPTNGYGLHDMAHTVWEWTVDWYSAPIATLGDGCCVPVDPREPSPADSLDPAQPQFRIPRKVIKGGSFGCADSYCMRYRPAPRRPQVVDTGMSHIGFAASCNIGIEPDVQRTHIGIVLDLPDVARWESWVAARHGARTEAWLRIATKESGIDSVTAGRGGRAPARGSSSAGGCLGTARSELTVRRRRARCRG